MAPRITCPKCGETFAFNLSAVETDFKRFDAEVQRWVDRCGGMSLANREVLARAAGRVPDGGTVSFGDIQWALGDIEGGAV